MNRFLVNFCILVVSSQQIPRELYGLEYSTSDAKISFPTQVSGKIIDGYVKIPPKRLTLYGNVHNTAQNTDADTPELLISTASQDIHHAEVQRPRRSPTPGVQVALHGLA